MPVQPILHAGVPLPRPQPLKCLCEYTHNDGYFIMCQRCFRWCHGSCFGLQGPELTPIDWQCWICAPTSHKLAGTNKGKAIRAQKARLERIEAEERASHFSRMEEIPALKSSALNVKEGYEALPSIKSMDIADDHCKPLLDRSLELLVSIQEMYDGSNAQAGLTLPDEIASLFVRAKTIVLELSSLSTVKLQIRNIKGLEEIPTLLKDITRCNSLIKHGPQSALPLGQRIRLAEAIRPVVDAENHKLRPAMIQEGSSADRFVQPRPSTCPGEEVSEGSLPYQNLSHVVRRSLQPYTSELGSKIHQLLSEFSTLEPLQALARCRQARYRLLQLCSQDLKTEQKASIDDAIKKDERLINDAILEIIKNKEHDDIERVLSLRENDAEAFIDLLQMTLESNAGISTSCRRNAHKLLVGLCESSGILPSSLKVQGVQLIDQNAVYGGGFADIYRASYQGQEVALKRMRVFQRGSERHKIHREFCKEALLWKRLRHPYLLPFIGIDSATFAPLLCMVSPWMGRGTLTRYVGEHPNVNLEELLLQTAEALQYLHSNNIVHGDLRGGNILINAKGEACLADFGLTAISEATAVTHTSNASGSIRWMAPELHDPESFGFSHFVRTTASDVYAFACVCLEVYTGASPFPKLANDSTVTLKVVQGKRPERPTETRRPLNDDIWGMIMNAWAQQPSDRPPISTIVKILRVKRVGQ